MEYAKKKELLKKLLLLEHHGHIDVFFTDEAGFMLTPCIPYGWQPKGEQKTIRSSKGKALNLFGLLSRRGKLITFATEANIDSAYLIECIDEFCLRVTRPTVLVLDNAPWHTSDTMEQKQKEWEAKGVYLMFLPTYSPHLNLIETLWRKIKYEWLNAEDYASKATLKDAVYTIIRKYDDEFRINFAENFLDANLQELLCS